MKRLKCWSTLFLAATVLAVACRAQDTDKAQPQKFDRLDFVVKELEGGKTVNSRSYFMTVEIAAKQKSEFRTGSQVPFQSSPGSWQQIDVGTSFECSEMREVPAGLSLSVFAQVKSILEQPSPADSGHPIIRQNIWRSTVVLETKRPTVIFSSDDPASKRQIQVELTATPIN
jgi:hypothetical protein